MSRSDIFSRFPRLKRTRFLLTSPETPYYNCIAWAAGDDTRWWWPVPRGGYWPPGVVRAATVEAFVAAFRTLGYEPCDDGSLEKAVEKVAIFLDDTGVPTHAARQTATGSWSSKLGKLEDIQHSLYGLEGDFYGTARVFLCRPRSS